MAINQLVQIVTAKSRKFMMAHHDEDMSKIFKVTDSASKNAVFFEKKKMDRQGIFGTIAASITSVIIILIDELISNKVLKSSR